MYKMNSPKVVSNEVGGEVIIINLDSGFYYSLNQTAGALWEAVARGVDPIEMKTALKNADHLFGAEDNQIIADFVKQLVSEELLIPSQVNDNDRASFDPTGLAGLTEKPAMEKYEDMQDLLLLDPIHEVAETGWPVKKEL
jgi:hypothetical protein